MMLGNVGIYAAKKRKKPVQKIPKPPPPDGIKSNPSKRHRDRLNSELDKLTSLLPFSEDVRARLDKLSVLRLSVGYLKVKSFFNATMQKGSTGWTGDRAVSFGGNGQVMTTIDGVTFSEADLLLQALNGFVLVVTAEGYVFYTSPTIQDYLGFHQSDVVHQSVFELIHTDDRSMFRRQLHFALNPNQFNPEQSGEECLPGMQSSTDVSSNVVTYDPQHIPPENSSFLERSFVCRFRCLLDNSSGFLALNFQGRLKYLHGQNKVAEDGTMVHPQLALFAIATPMQPPSILEIRTKTLIFQTKHKLDFTPMGIDSRGKVVLGYTETELCLRGSGYQFIHAADMMYCADNHVRMIKTGESGFTVFRLLTKTGVWVWVQANARLVYKGGRPDFIIARQRALTNEEGEEHLRQRKLQLPFNFATGEGLLYETGPSLDFPLIPGNGKAAKIRKMPDQKDLDPNSLLGSMLKQDHSVYIQPPDTDHQFSLDQAFMDSHALVNVPGDTWQEGASKTNGLVKEETAMRAMIDTLEQIIGDRKLCSSLEELDPVELQEWESALLKMNISNNDMSVEFNNILTNDIFTYVEEALFKENGMSQCPEQLNTNNSFPNNSLINQSTFVGGTESLPGVELQNSMLPVNQVFNHHNQMVSDQAVADPQSNFLGVGGQSLLGTGSEVRGMQKLTHMDPPVAAVLTSPAQMQPALQQTQPADVFTQSLELSELCAPNSLGQDNLMNFDLTSTQSCAQSCSQVRHGLPVSQTMHNPTKMNSLGLCPQKQMQSPQTAARQGLPNPMTLPLQNQTQPGVPVQQIPFQPQNPVNQSNQLASSQESQWLPSIPNTNFADDLLEACTSNVSVQSDLLSPSPSMCLQGQFSLQTQSSQSQGLQPWQQQQPLSTAAQNGHQHLPARFSQAPGFQTQPATGLIRQSSQNCRVGYGPQKTPNGVYHPHPQGVLSHELPPAGNSSCMFENSTPQVPVNGMQFSNMGALAATVPCQTQVPSYNESPPQASCYFQRNASGPIVGTSAISQGDTNISPTSCQMTPNFSPESLLSQAQYLSCSGQTQIPSHPPEENGLFSFPPLSNGATYFSESNQTNCCDF
ncbi:aryl hydrocarbon receptor 2 [Megalops cyprinoides]|uniref:aryl hydrocarbon receptor 2 n=1 Tax=Megalops cyprinoides TaxID=118141 RepID=UPI001864EE49|nr:aryl hydrocarbon receptor 2 [Megalops cyprinoides]